MLSSRRDHGRQLGFGTTGGSAVATLWFAYWAWGKYVRKTRQTSFLRAFGYYVVWYVLGSAAFYALSQPPWMSDRAWLAIFGGLFITAVFLIQRLECEYVKQIENWRRVILPTWAIAFCIIWVGWGIANPGPKTWSPPGADYDQRSIDCGVRAGRHC
jgi:hypothetical protein